MKDENLNDIVEEEDEDDDENKSTIEVDKEIYD